MGLIALAPPELQAAGAALQHAGGELSGVGARTLRGTGAGDLGLDELEEAVLDLCNTSFAVVTAQWEALSQVGRNLAASGDAYGTVDSRSMRPGGR